MRVTRLQHVSTPYPTGRHAEVRAFYGGVLGLVEKQLPSSFAGRPIVWYEAGEGEYELHFLPEDLPADSGTARHFGLEVDDLDDCRRRLEQAGYETREPTPIHARPRFTCRDPFGNLIELTAILGDYRKAG